MKIDFSRISSVAEARFFQVWTFDRNNEYFWTFIKILDEWPKEFEKLNLDCNINSDTIVVTFDSTGIW